jgi:hypothetical protein
MRHSHNVCCGDIATMFVAGTTNINVFFLVLSLQYMMGSLSRKDRASAVYNYIIHVKRNTFVSIFYGINKKKIPLSN